MRKKIIYPIMLGTIGFLSSCNAHIRKMIKEEDTSNKQDRLVLSNFAQSLPNFQHASHCSHASHFSSITTGENGHYITEYTMYQLSCTKLNDNVSLALLDSCATTLNDKYHDVNIEDIYFAKDCIISRKQMRDESVLDSTIVNFQTSSTVYLIIKFHTTESSGNHLFIIPQREDIFYHIANDRRYEEQQKNLWMYF